MEIAEDMDMTLQEMAPGETQDLEEVRVVVRDLLDEWLEAGRFVPACDSWLRRYDLDFSRAMGSRGLLALSLPREYGGGAFSAVARLVVTEEVLRSGAPVAAHWIADRQIGPSILRHGTEEAKRRYLPGIASGELTFCLGMSETEAGSDLASVRTTATRVDDGWSITGRKIWTSQGHRSTHAYVLARTEKGEVKHDGLSEFVVDMSSPGVEVRPILDLRGEHHFNEITFDDVRVPDSDVLGTIGDGWRQVTDQLSLERGGIERVLSTYPLLAVATDDGTGDPAALGRMYARLATLRRMAAGVAGRIDSGASPVFEAAVLKDLGTTFERDVNEFARERLDVEPDPDDPGAGGLLAQGILAAPGFTIRGGTSEVLRTLIARGVGTARAGGDEHELRSVVDDVLGARGGDPDVEDGATWELLVDLGWPGIGVPEEAGGSGGDLVDLAEVVAGLGRHAVSEPVAEAAVAARAVARAGGAEQGVLTVATGPAVAGRRVEDELVLDGRIDRVAWARRADGVLVPVELDGRPRLVLVPAATSGVTVEPGANLAGEPRDRMTFDGARVPASSVLDGVAPEDVADELALLRAVASLGALETAVARTVEHARTREQFGRPLIKFQAVAGLVASAASLLETARVATEHAVAARDGGDATSRQAIATARVVVGIAATECARIAHQVHAAMGVTREHPLHLSTRRLWSWRDEVGTERSWAEELGSWLASLDEPTRWRWLTGRASGTTTSNQENEVDA